MRDRDAAHCADCGRRWEGRRECHCCGCHQQFGSPRAFDRHQVGGRCLTVEEMVASVDGEPRLRLWPVSRVSGTTWVTRRLPADVGARLTAR